MLQNNMLLVGPPGSGKTSTAVERLESARKRGEPAQLVVPTASMAEHLVHEMARRSGLAAGDAVISLARFVAGLTPQCREASRAARTLLVERALQRTGEFAPVAGYGGFQAKLLETIEEFRAAGVEAQGLGAFGRVMAEYARLLEAAGLVDRTQRLRLAAAELRGRKPETLLFEGFLNLTAAELELVGAAGGTAEQFPPPEEGAASSPAPVVVRAPSPEREMEDIAARILRDREATGRPFRAYGLILRNPQTYGPLIAPVMERFGIPLRLNLPQRLDRMSLTRRLIGRLEPRSFSEELAPAAWSERCADLAGETELPETVAPVTEMELRTLAQTRQAWRAAAAEASDLLGLEGNRPLAYKEYRRVLERILALTSISTPDLRRNAVHALSVYEARQWELPVVFVCGLVERQFPRHHAQNLFFDDAARRKLAASGAGLRASADLEGEERLLFDLATSRATDELYLTHPARGEDGVECVPSRFLEGLGPAVEAGQARIREPAPDWQPAPGVVRSAALRSAVADKHQRFSPSSLERYLQCPFQFFARDTLRLAEPPQPPDERLDELVLGTIAHRAIARWWTNGAGDIAPVLDAVFDEVCREEGIATNFRAEAKRTQLRRDLERFAADERARALPPGFRAEAPESAFEYVLDATSPPFRVRGRIDLCLVSSSGAAIVVDYKYSAKGRIKRLVEEHEEGARIQAPLYLLGLEKQRGLQPAGMIFHGLRNEVSRRGWYAAGAVPPDRDLIEKSPAELRSQIAAAAARAAAAVEEIRGGRIEVEPRDRQICRRYCPYIDVCRVAL